MHGDDFVSLRSPEDLEWLRTMWAKKYCPNTTVTCSLAFRIGVTIEAGLRHVEILLEDTGAKHDEIRTATKEREQQHRQQHRQQRPRRLHQRHPGQRENGRRPARACIARMNYLATDQLQTTWQKLQHQLHRRQTPHLSPDQHQTKH